MAIADAPTRRRDGILFRLPLIGVIARDIRREPESVFYLIAGLLSLLTIATVTWGVVVLAMTALAMVPVIFALLIAVTRG